MQAKFVPSIKARRQYHRVIVPFFYHSSIAHLIVDLIPLTLYGYSV
jgi:hypothetical protein